MIMKEVKGEIKEQRLFRIVAFFVLLCLNASHLSNQLLTDVFD